MANLSSSDIVEINRLNKQQDFYLDSLDNCIIDKVIPGIAYGIVREFAEAVILLDLEKPKVTRVKALAELMKIAIFGVQQKGLHQLHVFVKTEEVAKLLERKFNFKRITDIPMVRDI